MRSVDRTIVEEVADAPRMRPSKANDSQQRLEGILWPMLTPREYGTTPASPEECEEVYCGAEPPMNSNDREEVKRLIAQESRKGFALWAKESLAFGIVMVGAGFIVHSYIPAQIGSQTREMGEDISGLKTSLGTVQHDVGEIKSDLKDAINKAFNRALDGLQSRAIRLPTKGGKEQDQSALELSASTLGLRMR